MKRSLHLAALLAAAGPLLAASSVTEEWRVNLVRTGGTTQGTYAGATIQDAVDACRKALVTTVSREYDCQTPRLHLIVTVSADPPPPPTCTAPKPAAETRAQACPTGTAGTWSQARTYSSVAYPTCWAAGDWSPSAPLATDCPAIPPPVVAEPPPTGDAIIVSAGQSISAAVAKLQPGGTVIVKPGTYAPFDLKACAATAWCTVKAETDGTVNVTGLDWGAGNWYTRVEGLKFTGSATKSVTGSFLKFFRTSFAGGPATGNASTFTIGTNDRTPGASNVLVEDSWVYGPGGRYKLLVYNAEKIVLRRVVVRHDGGWKYDQQNPQGGIAIYDSRDVLAENAMCLDSAQGLDGFEACIYLVSNGTTATKAQTGTVTGAIVIDSPNNGVAAEGTASATWTVTDSAVLRSAQGGFNTNGAGHLVIARAYANVKGAPFAAWNGSLAASSCAYKGAANSGASLASCSSTLPASITLPNATGQGATIVKRIGVSGTLFGEPGFDQVTSDALWPYPNETRIRADFDLVRPAFGGRSLTGYVQGATP